MPSDDAEVTAPGKRGPRIALREWVALILTVLLDVGVLVGLLLRPRILAGHRS